MTDPLDPIRRRHAALNAAQTTGDQWNAHFVFTAYSKNDVATLLAEVDRLLARVAELEALTPTEPTP